jgi:hypothetical protein
MPFDTIALPGLRHQDGPGKYQNIHIHTGFYHAYIANAKVVKYFAALPQIAT